jgi:putative methyltransferase (TIGR04325 family)
VRIFKTVNDTKNKINSFNIWEGIYPDFQSALVDAKGAGFSGDVYRMRSLQAGAECLAALNSGEPIPAFHKQRSTHLPLVVAMMLGYKKNVRILDFGGGLGIGYMTLAECVPADLKRIDYQIVEVPEVCKAGMDLLEGRGVIYKTNLPTTVKYDLIHAASSLQYIEHWQDLLAKFAALGPKYILLSDVFAGSIQSYVSLQNYYESKIPHWFLNLNVLLNTFHKHGYRMVLKSYATSRRLDAVDTLPMSNFPENLRLTQSLHLLFKRNK